MYSDEWFSLAAQALFIYLWVIILFNFVYYQLEHQLDIALLIGSIAFLLLIKFYENLQSEEAYWLTTLGWLILVFHPFLTLRIASYYYRVPAWIAQLYVAHIMVSWVIIILYIFEGFSSFFPAAFALFILSEAYATGIFIRSAYKMLGITQYRLAFIALGNITFTLSVILFSVQYRYQPDHTFLASMINLCMIGSGLGYYFGFAPPGWLRQFWHNDALKILQKSVELARLSDNDVLVQYLSQASCKAVDANAAGIISQFPQVSSLYVFDIHTQSTQNYPDLQHLEIGVNPLYILLENSNNTELQTLSKVYNAEAIYLVPILVDGDESKYLVVFLGHRALFYQDDLSLLSLLAVNIGLYIQTLERLNLQQTTNFYIKTIEEAAILGHTGGKAEVVLQEVMELLCQKLDFALGHIYLMPHIVEVFGSNSMYYFPMPINKEIYQLLFETTEFSSNEGVIAHVIHENTPFFVEDISKTAFSFRRYKVALQCGLFSALALPIMMDGKLIALVEFFGNQARVFEQQFIERFDQLKILTGQLIKRYCTEIAIQQSATHLSIIHHIDRTILAGGEFDDISQFILKSLQQAYQCQRVNVTKIDIQKNEGVALASLDQFGTRYLHNQHFSATAVYTPDIFSDLFRGNIILIPDLAQAKMLSYSQEKLLENGIRSVVTVPIFFHEGAIGTLNLEANTPQSPLQEKFEPLQDVANAIGVLLHQEILRQERKIAHDRWEGIINLAVDAIISVNQQQEIILFNNGAETIFGYHADEILGSPLDILLPKELSHVHRKHIENFEHTHATARMMGERREIRAVRKNGEEFPAEGSISRLELKNEVIFTVILRDISEQKMITNALVASERKYRKIVETALEGIWTVDEDGLTTYTNQRLADMLGYTREEMLGKPILDFVLEDDHLQVNKNLERRKQGISEKLAFKYRRKDGSSMWARISATPLQDSQGEHIGAMAMLTDITNEFLAEENIRKSEARFRSIFGTVLVGLWEFDVSAALAVFQRYQENNGEKATLSDKNIQHILACFTSLDSNYYCLEMMAVRRQAELNLKWKQLLLPESIQMLLELLDSLQCGEKSFKTETRFLNMQGQVKDILVFANLADMTHNKNKIWLTMVDVTEHNQMIRRLSQKDKLYLTLVQNLPDTAVFLFDRDLRYLLVDGNAVQTANFQKEALEGQILEEILPSNFATTLMAVYRKVFDNEESLFQINYQDACYEMHVMPVYDANGEIFAGLHLAYDITQLKEKEAEILQLNNELEERVQARTAELQIINQELEAFSYSVSHDLRGPLRAVDGFSKILIEDFASSIPTDAQHYLTMIHENSQQMGHLIDDLLMLSRLSRRKMEDTHVDLLPIIHNVIAELRLLDEERNIVISIDENIPPCIADVGLMRVVLKNLLENAFKYTRKNEVSHIEIGYIIQDDTPVYFVKDDGVGFDMKHGDKIFGVFQRLHRSEDYEGTGIGLAIVQRVINQYQGKIWAEAKVNLGATFYFMIPRKGATHAATS